MSLLPSSLHFACTTERGVCLSSCTRFCQTNSIGFHQACEWARIIFECQKSASTIQLGACSPFHSDMPRCPTPVHCQLSKKPEAIAAFTSALNWTELLFALWIRNQTGLVDSSIPQNPVIAWVLRKSGVAVMTGIFPVLGSLRTFRLYTSWPFNSFSSPNFTRQGEKCDSMYKNSYALDSFSGRNLS